MEGNEVWTGDLGSVVAPSSNAVGSSYVCSMGNTGKDGLKFYATECFRGLA